MKTITINVEMTQDAAWEFAQFLKRANFYDFFDKTPPHLPESERKELAYRAISGVEAVQKSLKAAGIDPR